MEVNKDIIEEGNKLVHQLTVVRDQFVKNDTNYDSLKNSIESLISELLKVN